jgi:YgiT-type zinc finger domain-containing protein
MLKLCVLCKQSPLKFSVSDERIVVPTGPTFFIKTPCLSCSNCGENYFEDLTQNDLNGKIISKLYEIYKETKTPISGAACCWIRMKILLSREELNYWGDPLVIKQIEQSNNNLPNNLSDNLFTFIEKFLQK